MSQGQVTRILDSYPGDPTQPTCHMLQLMQISVTEDHHNVSGWSFLLTDVWCFGNRKDNQYSHEQRRITILRWSPVRSGVFLRLRLRLLEYLEYGQQALTAIGWNNNARMNLKWGARVYHTVKPFKNLWRMRISISLPSGANPQLKIVEDSQSQ